jgi:integrase/recombinase XerD
MDSERIFRDLEIFIKQKNFSKQTFYTYRSGLKLFCNYFREKDHPQNINSKEIVEFLASVNENRGVCQERTCFWALYFWYVNIEKQPHKFDGIRSPKMERRIQEIPTHEYIMGKLGKINNPHDKAIIATFYATGVRLMELCKIERKDINRENLSIILHLCKGGKDRIVSIPKELIPILEAHWSKLSQLQRTSRYLFPGTNPEHYMSDSTAYRAVKENIGIKTHLLRHAYATYLHENGSTLKTIADILGHSSTKTTEIYTHTSLQLKRQQPNPLVA